MDLLCDLTRREDPALRLNGIWALMNMAFQAEQKIKTSILTTLETDQIFRLLSDPDVDVLMKTLGLLRNLLSTKTVGIRHSHLSSKLFHWTIFYLFFLSSDAPYVQGSLPEYEIPSQTDSIILLKASITKE